MGLLNNMLINSFSIIILIIIFVYSKSHRDNKLVNDKIFMTLLILTVILLVLDVLSRLDGYPETILPYINSFANFFIFLFNPLISSLWVLFVYNYIYKSEYKQTWALYLLIGFNIFNTVMVILSQWYGWLYYIDSNNLYHRGPLFMYTVVVTFSLLFLASFLIVRNRSRIESKHFLPLLFFTVPSLICIVLQLFILDISFILNGVVLSILIIFLYVQNQDIITDYSTGVNNRNKLELYLKNKIRKSNKNNSFSAIMIDLDHFKDINDTYGHQIGDEALKIAVKLIKKSLRQCDFIARYGGDEFFIVVDTTDILELEKIVNNIYSLLEKHNKISNSPYVLGFSMGYAIYDYNEHLSVAEFQNKIDKLLYTDKIRTK